MNQPGHLLVAATAANTMTAMVLEVGAVQQLFTDNGFVRETATDTHWMFRNGIWKLDVRTFPEHDDVTVDDTVTVDAASHVLAAGTCTIPAGNGSALNMAIRAALTDTERNAVVACLERYQFTVTSSPQRLVGRRNGHEHSEQVAVHITGRWPAPTATMALFANFVGVAPTTPFLEICFVAAASRTAVDECVTKLDKMLSSGPAQHPSGT